MPMSTRVRSARVRSVRYALAVALLVPLAGACGGDSLKPQPVPEPSEVFWDLLLSDHAVTMALTPPYDTLTVVATPRNYQGEALAGLPRPQYRSLDPSLVGVTADGVLIAVAAPQTPDTFATIVARLTVDNVSHEDTLTVRVVDDPSPQDHLLETFSIHPVLPDSAKWGATSGSGGRDGVTGRLLNAMVRATFVGGVPVPTASINNWDFLGPVDVPNLHVSIRSSDTTKAVVTNSSGPSSPGVKTVALFGVRPGTIRLYASATVFGVRKVDTLLFQIGLPLFQNVIIRPSPTQSSEIVIAHPSVMLGTGGSVVWINESNISTDIVFDDPTKVTSLSTSTVPFWLSQMPTWCAIMQSFDSDCTDSGNLTAVPGSAFYTGAIRVFHVPGVYDYHDSFGHPGRITVSGD